MSFIQPKFTIQCNVCNEELDVKRVECDNYGTVTFQVMPCNYCIKAAEDSARDAGYENGESEGKSVGDGEGYERGYHEGRKAGDEAGYVRGHSAGKLEAEERHG